MLSGIVLRVPFRDPFAGDLKMLIILSVFPGASPFKPVFNERLTAQIIFIDHIGKLRGPVQIGFTVDRFY